MFESIIFFYRELDDEVGMGEVDVKVNHILSLNQPQICILDLL